MVLNAAVQILGEAEVLKQKISNFKSGTCMLQEHEQWAMQQQLQRIYQKVLILDLDYALEKKVEQDLWNIGFKQQIEALQSITKDRKNPLRSEAQSMLTCVLQAAAGFYLCLLHQICTAFKLDLPFRRRASLLGLVEGWRASGEVGVASKHPPAAAVRYATQHCLVHLGDLARYRQQLSVACSFYRHALMVSAHSGQPYNQLALVWWRRGRRLAALYWHVRSLLVRAPFPPAARNLRRTLNAATDSPLPVLPGLPPSPAAPAAAAPRRRLDSPAFVDELVRALNLIYNHDDLEVAEQIVTSLNTSLSALIATDSFDSMTLIKMACVIIWLVEWTTERYTLDAGALTESEKKAVALSYDLAAGAILAHLLPTYTADVPHENALPSLKTWLSWVSCNVEALREASWRSRAQLWTALAHTLTCLANQYSQHDHTNDSVPLPEDIELHGFLPIEGALSGIRFPEQATWDTYGGRVPDVKDDDDIVSSPLDVGGVGAAATRGTRLLRLGLQIADARPDLLTYSTEDDKLKFSTPVLGGDPPQETILELVAPPPPLVISEADFREKVRDKRVGILKPQGSLERAREERLAGQTVEETQQDVESAEQSAAEERRERRPRMNVAMAAIMRRQDENKQVKFVTPPATPDSTSDSTDTLPKDEDKPKLIQPKPIKSLADIPVGRKTGGILSLKDKSAGYPHLVNAEPEKPKEEKENKPIILEQPPQQNWKPPPPQYEPRPPIQKHTYGLQNTGLNYNPNYQNTINHGIRLPVVNPKEIDVRTAALQKQNARQDLLQDGRYQGDKKNFLNDLPPRFANQYRYWQTAQDNHFNTQENKFRDDNFNQGNNSLFGTQSRNWMNPTQENYPPPWWKPDQPNMNFNQGNVQPNFYSPLSANVSNPYPNLQYQNAKQDYTPNFMQPPPPLPNLISSNFNYNYQPSVSYDSAMYPQFNTMYPPPQINVDKYQSSKDGGGRQELGFGGNVLDMQRNTLKFTEPQSDLGKNADPTGGSTYSLFSARGASWGPPPQPDQQSLWSGPGPSPLERLLEQQKLSKPPAEPH